MARNRKTESAATRFGPALKAVLLCVLIGGSGVGYVWQKDQISRLGKQIKARELRLADLQNQNEKLRRQLAGMRGPLFLESQIAKLNLGLVPPQQAQVLLLPEPSAETPNGSDGQRQYADAAAASGSLLNP